MFRFDLQKCLAEMRKAEKDDLLDRVTAYREGYEPAIVSMIEEELRRRGVKLQSIEERMAECRRDCLFDDSGVALQCSSCRRPAVTEVWGWHRMWGVLPLFPRVIRCCNGHRPATGDG
jgi:hypothetical protein